MRKNMEVINNTRTHKKRFLALLFCISIIGLCMLFVGCGDSGTNNTNGTGNENNNVENINNETKTIEDYVVNWETDNIYFGCSLEDVMGSYDIEPMENSISQDNVRYVAYPINVNQTNGYTVYYFNDNSELYLTLFCVNEEPTFKDYENDFNTIYNGLVNKYGEPTENLDDITNPNATDIAYECSQDNSSYSRRWDIDGVKVSISMSQNTFIGDDGVSICVDYQSKNIIQDKKLSLE